MRRNIIIPVFSVILFLVLLDKAVKYYDKLRPAGPDDGKKAVIGRFLSQKQISDYLKATELRLYPYIMFAPLPGFKSETININSIGLRGGETAGKQEGVIRIAVVGGSGALGYGASSDRTTFSSVLEGLLNTGPQKEYEVLNAALPSAIAMQEFIWIAQTVIDLRPDVIIVFDGFNDMIGHSSADRKTGYPFKFSELEDIVSRQPMTTRAFIRKRLMNYRPAKKIIEMMENRKRQDKTAAARYAVNAGAADYYGKTLDRISHLVKSYGARPVFVFQPSVFGKAHPGSGEKIILSEFPDNASDVFREMLLLGRQAMENTCVNNDDIFLDASSVFNNIDEDIFMDQAHFGDKGQAVVAQYLLDELKARGLF